jgi:hypothetical protein
MTRLFNAGSGSGCVESDNDIQPGWCIHTLYLQITPMMTLTLKLQLYLSKLIGHANAVGMCINKSVGDARSLEPASRSVTDLPASASLDEMTHPALPAPTTTKSGVDDAYLVNMFEFWAVERTSLCRNGMVAGMAMVCGAGRSEIRSADERDEDSRGFKIHFFTPRFERRAITCPVGITQNQQERAR